MGNFQKNVCLQIATLAICCSIGTFFSGKSWGSINSPMSLQNIFLLVSGHLSLWYRGTFLNKSLQKAQLFQGWDFSQSVTAKQPAQCTHSQTGIPRSCKGVWGTALENYSQPTCTLSSRRLLSCPGKIKAFSDPLTKYLLSTFSVPATTLDTGCTAVNSSSWGLQSSGELNNEQIHQHIKLHQGLGDVMSGIAYPQKLYV